MAFKFKGIGENGRQSKPIKLLNDEDIDYDLTPQQINKLNSRLVKKRAMKESYGYCGIVCCTSSKRDLRATSIWKHLK